MHPFTLAKPHPEAICAKIFPMRAERAIIRLNMNTSVSRIGNKVVVLAVFGIAMGFLEAVVVVYLRQLYYPEGFSFPLRLMAPEAFPLESIREFSTIVMLVCIGFVAGRNFPERFAWGLYCFGVWDIFYYVWLKALLDWPPSVMTWDILFLIPVVWSGPVLAPLICSLTMLMIAAVILIYEGKGQTVRISRTEWTLLYLGAGTIVSSFVWEYAGVIIMGGFLSRLSSLGEDPAFREAIAAHVPDLFNWPLFFSGEVLALLFVVIFLLRMKKTMHPAIDKDLQ